jgi:hypothetical protein
LYRASSQLVEVEIEEKVLIYSESILLLVMEMSESVMKEELKLDSELMLDSEFLVKAVIKLMKRDIFVRYKQTGEITDEDWEFCEKIDWHPVDELPLKEEFKGELEQRRKGPFIKFRSVEEIFEE